MFQGVYPSKKYTDLAGKDSNVYCYADEHESILPEGVKAVTSVDDWIYILENLPDDVELYDDNCSGETSVELAQKMRNAEPESLESFCERTEKERDRHFAMLGVFQSIQSDNFIDRKGYQFSYRTFS